MHVSVNGCDMDVEEGATLGDVISGQPYREGAELAVIRSVDEVKKTTSNFEIVTTEGSMVLALNESEHADLFKDNIEQIIGLNLRWHTSGILAFGSFPTDLPVNESSFQYSRYECFFALGGFDNSTTYIMISKQDHERGYGTRKAVFGKITRGRHLLEKVEEGERIEDVRPLVLSRTKKDAFSTSDLSTRLEEGMSIETYVSIALSEEAPMSAEHILVTSERGVININEKTHTYSACTDNLNVSLVKGPSGVREENVVTVRHEGAEEGKIYFYQKRRQLSPFHTIAGRLENGQELIRLAPEGSRVTTICDPPRLMTIGMTQKEGQELLNERSLEQKRTGSEDDDSVIVEQEPELTMYALNEDRIETYGVPREEIHVFSINDSESPKTAQYFRDITGLDHKQIGTLKVHFTFEGMPMVTFEGSESLAGRLAPEKSFDEVSERGDVGVTNMSRPQKGLVGIRLKESDEFGPTGEEPHGTNILGKITSSLENLMDGLEDGDIIYVREE